jgi:hypothetical protein
MGNPTLTFKTPKALINGLVPILVTLGKANPYVYMDIFPEDVQLNWHSHELSEDARENLRQYLETWLPWPNPKRHGGGTVTIGEGHRRHIITVTLT